MADLEALLEPIGEERPGGDDVSYGDDFAQLLALRELTDNTQEANPTPDYDGVVDIASRILEEQSKDVRVALYLAEALLHTDGFQGFHSGLDLVHQLLDRFPEAAHPEDADERAYTLDFLVGALQADSRQDPSVIRAIKLYPLTDWGHHLYHYDEWKKSKPKDGGDAEGGEDGDATSDNFGKGFVTTGKAYYKELKAGIGPCVQALDALEAWGKEHLEGTIDPKETPIPRYSKLKAELQRLDTAVQDLLDRKLVDDPDPVETAAPALEAGSGDTTEGGATGDASPTVAAAPSGQAPEPADAADAAQRVVVAARFLRRANPTDPAPYMVVRSLRWGEIRSAGTLDKRLLEPPTTELRRSLKELLLDEDWEALLDAGEQVMGMPCGRGWLDLQRYVITALDNLGPSYKPVSEAIQGQLAALLRVVPELLEFSMMDDMPTANGETREWLELAGITGEGGSDGGSEGSPDYDRERLLSEATHEKALEWVATGNPKKGIELLMKRSDREESERARFITESLAASIMVDAGMAAVAKPMLEDLVGVIKSRKLEEWESAAVVARPLGLLFRCLPGNDRQRSELYDQIARLDPVHAMTLDHEAPSPAGPPPTRGQPFQPDEPKKPSQEAEAVDSGSADSE